MKFKKVIASLLVGAMAMGLFAGCGGTSGGNGAGGTGTGATGAANGEEPITLTVFSELANYSGEMQGWFAKILLDKWNVKINLVAAAEGVYETRMEDGDLGDIVVWGSDGKNYIT